jgi:hypothetical protein
MGKGWGEIGPILNPAKGKWEIHLETALGSSVPFEISFFL